MHTLQSVLEAASSLGLRGVTVILSDSSETTETVDAARAWAQQKDVQLLVDRSERRRSAKEARNVLMARASSEILVQVDADVVLPAASLFHLLSCLTEPAPKVAIGTTLPDPRVRGLAYGASRWQLKAVRRHASWLPADAVRSEGAFWAAWRSFYSAYRFPVGAESFMDDVILARHLIEQGIEVRNCWRAVVYKLPAATLRDFMLQTHRGYAAGGAHPRRRQELGAAAVEAAKDPLGALLYARARLWSAREQRRRPSSWEEEWDVARSTKRG